MEKEMPAFRRRLKNTPPVRLIVESFLLVILLGALLLMLPVSSRDGTMTSFLSSLFTSTSAVCVTGLVLFDTWQHWSVFGQSVILCLIQIGGLGLVTFTTGISLLVKRRLGLRGIQLATENTSGSAMHIVRHIKIILAFTFVCEFFGALLLMLRFVPQYGLHGLWISVFTAVSAYCNAGFDIMGFTVPGSSLTAYVADPLVSLTVAALIVTGGIGFLVISNFYAAKVKSRLQHETVTHLSFHSHIVLWTTACLILGGTVLFLATEWDNKLAGMGFGVKLNAALFQSVTTRTAGFNTIDIGSMRDISKIGTIILMFIGASPASTGGGIKTTTFVVLIAAVVSTMRGREEAELRGRRIDKSTVYRALSIISVAVVVVLITCGAIMACNPQTNGIDALFEATSAFGTVGLSAGVTPTLTAVSKCFVILAMFIGRVGPVSLGLAVALRRPHIAISCVLPEGRVVVG